MILTASRALGAACALFLCLAAPGLSGCASSGGPTATSLPAPDPVRAAAVAQPDYVLGPLDRISISVFQAPDVSLKDVQVDTSGQVSMPLIGPIKAAGRTATQLAGDIAGALGRTYLQDPQVTVQVEEANSQKVTVEGAVNQPGVFQVDGETTLLQTIALARGPSRTADEDHVAIFRTISGQRAAAVFDLNSIRQGKSPDPKVYGGDMVVVRDSSTRGIWQELLRAVPLIGVFRYF